MKTSLILTLFIAFTCHFADAKVKVAFFELKAQDGQYLSLETGGRLYHVAIQYGDRWLDAHPFEGVREVNDVHSLGHLYSVIELDRDIPSGKYIIEMGKTFSTTDEWSNNKTTYCSKMVAQILDIPPSQMTTRAGLGISPDRLYHALKREPHREVRTCSSILFL